MYTNYDKRQNLAQKTQVTQNLRRIGRGIGAVRESRAKMVLLAGLWIMAVSAWVVRYPLMGYGPDTLLAPLLDALAVIMLLLLTAALSLALLWAWGGPWQAGQVQDNLLRIGLVNTAGEAPTLLSVTTNPSNPKVRDYSFYTCGIPVPEWLDRADKIQSALNGSIADIIYGMDETLETLAEFKEEMERRKKLLRDSNCSNIDEYNTIFHETKLRRWVFACDEIAMMLDKTGQSKEQKEKIDQASTALSLLACQGRNFGLHLILATQRPDANVMPTQVRSNVDFRVCGRADSILSSIIIDSTAAADLIPKNSKGLFVLNDSSGKDTSATVFKAYILPDGVD